MPRLLILLTFPPEVTEQYRSRLSRTFPEIAIEVAATADKAVAALADADMLITFGQMIKNLKLDFAAARNLKWVQALGTGLDGITDQPALQARRHRDKPARRAWRAGVGGGARFDAGAVPRPAGLRARAGRASVEALAGQASARQDRRHPRHRRDRRGAGAEMQGAGHDGRRHHVVAAKGRGLRPRPSGRRAFARCLPASITLFC